ncbi:MAG: HupE/UreJ family protein [Acidobacteria bacterium]|nr:HupE/UreJ family protein [Acidobacteriota bacterium]
MKRVCQFGLFSVCLLFAHLAEAHDLERTQVSLRFERDGAFVLDISHDPNWLLLRLERFSETPLDPQLGRDEKLRELSPAFIDRVVLFVDKHEVRPASAEYLPGLATYRLRGRMPANARILRWYYGLVVDPYPLTIQRADGRSINEWVGGDAWSSALDLSGQFEPPSRWRVALQYLALGYTHILPKGVDHILFVIGIFLLTMQLRPILIQVTAFTIAHSITLGLTMYGVVSLPSRVVEPLIALSIAYVAIENLVTNELKPVRLLLVFSFGLLHGMGFAGVLQQLGLPRSEFLTALLSFNLGVEAGQLTVIGLACFSVIWFRRRHWYHRRIVMPSSLLIAAIGVYWTISRIISPQ